MRSASGSVDCLLGLVLDFGPVALLPYKAGTSAHVYVVTQGGLGSIGIKTAEQDGSIIQRVRTGRGAHNFLLAPDGKTLYVSNRVAGTISLLDPATLAVTGTFVAPGGPDDMAISAKGQELWVTGRWRASVNVLDRNTGVLKATIPVGRSPHGIFVY